MSRRLAPKRVADILGAAGSVAIVALAAYVLSVLLSDQAVPVDFHFYLDAAQDVRAGDSPYPESAYTPFGILGAVPFTFLSVAVADVLVKSLLVVGVGVTLYVLGVRDWRCYPLALLWPPVIHAVQTANVTIILVLAAAVVWRFRDRARAPGIALGASIALKFILWPLWAWLLVVGRRRTALWSAAAAVLLSVGSFAAIGLSTLLEYPEALRAYPDSALEGYSLDVLGEDLGFDPLAARLAMLGVACLVLVSMIVAGRRGNEASSFVLAIGATLAFSPYVWLHYFALLLVPVAIVRARLSPIWFVPLGMWAFGAGTGNGSTVDATAVVGLAALTLLLAYRAAPGRSEATRSVSPGVARVPRAAGSL
ncbi:MAG: glycosyltransferase family 87 protein [Gaiellaceae bacterium]